MKKLSTKNKLMPKRMINRHKNYTFFKEVKTKNDTQPLIENEIHSNIKYFFTFLKLTFTNRLLITF